MTSFVLTRRSFIACLNVFLSTSSERVIKNAGNLDGISHDLLTTKRNEIDRKFLNQRTPTFCERQPFPVKLNLTFCLLSSALFINISTTVTIEQKPLARQK